MSAPDHERLSLLFLAASALEPGERRAYLDRACGDDQALRRDVESLLRSSDDVPSLLERGPLDGGLLDDLLSAPDAIGPYRILEKLGEGGMGVVYRAEQTAPIRRQVALKLIKLGLETEKVIARFKLERHLLALLEHPHIARVLDAGVTPQGRPYFVMESVAGEPVTDFCDRRSLDVTARIRLFLQVCDAVHHAHQNSVIHRDLKPSNVLVSMVDGTPVPKIIDFGVAKALDRSVPLESTLTEAGQFIGTPEYVSPEQAAPAMGNVDTRADVYSLGALLYELLVGVPPLSARLLREGNLEALRRLILLEVPRRPSARVGERGEAAAAVRRTSPGSLARRLRGDLDCIVMKALEKERSRRYGAVSDLAADLRRHLSHDPIEARPAGALYRFGRFARRHRMAVGLVSAFLPLLLGFTIAMTLLASGLAVEGARARKLSDLLTRFYDVPLFVGGRHGAPDAGTILARSAERIDRELLDEPLLRARVAHAMGSTLRGIGDIEAGVHLMERARASLGLQLGADHETTLAAMHSLAQAYAQQGRARESEALFRETLRARRRVLGDAAPDSLRTMSALGFLFKSQARHREAAALFEEALGGMRRRLGPGHSETLLAGGLLASVYLDLRRLDKAEALLVEALSRMTSDHPEHAMALYNLACVLALRGDREGALERFRRATAEEGFVTQFFADANLGPLRDDPEFLALARRARLQDGRVLAGLDERGRDLMSLGRYREAEILYRHILDNAPEPASRQYRTFRHRLARILLHQTRYAEARRMAEAIRGEVVRELGENGHGVGEVDWFLGQVHLAEGSMGGYLAAVERAESIFSKSPSYGWIPYLRACREALGGRRGEALRSLEEAVESGFPHLHLVLEDRALRSLRGTPEMESILARLSRRFEYP